MDEPSWVFHMKELRVHSHETEVCDGGRLY